MRDKLEYIYSSWPARPALKAAMRTMGGEGGIAPGGPAGGDRATWAGRDRARNHRRQETIGGDKGFRAGKMEGVWTDEEPTARECRESKENRRGRNWGVLCAGWNEAARAIGHNTRDRGIRIRQTTGGRVKKADVTGCGISLASLNIWTGRAGGWETALRAFQ